MSDNRTIYVQIPAYRDSELIPTIRDLVSSASRPDALRISVCWQHGADESIQGFIDCGFQILPRGATDDERLTRLLCNGSTLLVQSYKHTESLGCGWARAQTQRYFEGERYALQIDSHHRFLQNWDGEMINMLEGLRGKSRWPILTGYPPGYDPSLPKPAREVRAMQMDFGKFGGYGLVIPRQSWIDKDEMTIRPQLARFFSAGFCFSDGHFVTNVPYDPNHFFASEEISMAVRSFTSGYDLYHPHKTLLWHYYLRSDAPKIWSDHNEAAVIDGLVAHTADERAAQSGRYIRRLFGLVDEAGPVYGGSFGFGGQRTLSDYERFAGISFSHRGVTREVTERCEPGRKSYSDEEWLTSLICERSIALRLTEVGSRLSKREVSRITVQIFNEIGAPVSVHDATESEMEWLRTTGDLDIAIETRTSASSVLEECVVRFWGDEGALIGRFATSIDCKCIWPS